jgi:glycosyltransferase involved in cell wall biosynthesis
MVPARVTIPFIVVVELCLAQRHRDALLMSATASHHSQPSRTGVCVFARDEERDIGEWIAFNLAVGFDAVVLYDNGSVDSTPDIVRRFSQKFDVRLKDWPTTEATAQPKAYENCLGSQFGSEHQWVAFLDADELIVPRHGGIKELLERNADAAGIAVNWAMFGSSGHARRPPGLMIETFQRRAKSDHRSCKVMKEIVRPSSVYRVLPPCYFGVRGHWARPSGRALMHETVSVPEHSVAQINHYYTKSREEWDRRRRRGYRNAYVGKRARNDWASVDHNVLLDRGALRFVPAVKEILATVGLV